MKLTERTDIGLQKAMCCAHCKHAGHFVFATSCTFIEPVPENFNYDWEIRNRIDGESICQHFEFLQKEDSRPKYKHSYCVSGA